MFGLSDTCVCRSHVPSFLACGEASPPCLLEKGCPASPMAQTSVSPPLRSFSAKVMDERMPDATHVFDFLRMTSDFGHREKTRVAATTTLWVQHFWRLDWCSDFGRTFGACL